MSSSCGGIDPGDSGEGEPARLRRATLPGQRARKVVVMRRGGP